MSYGASSAKDYDVTYKVLLIGESAVGKSSLIRCYSQPHEAFTPALLPTYGIDFVNVITTVDGIRVRLQIWDTAGQERFRTLTSMHFRGTKGVLLVYDITNEQSFNQLQYWLKTMNKHALMYEEVILVGNKCDLDREDWMVDSQTGEEFARQHGLKFYQTSAKASTNVAEVFEELAKNMKYANNPTLDSTNKVKSSFDIVDGIVLPSFNYGKRNVTLKKTNSTACCHSS